MAPGTNKVIETDELGEDRGRSGAAVDAHGVIGADTPAQHRVALAT
jgi:hypothetical protein